MTTWTTLIDAPALRAALAAGTPPLVVVDAGFDLADTGAGERDHAAGHLPGALYWHLDRDLSGAKTGRNGRHPLPERAAFAATAGAAGIAPATQVVVYDAQGGVYASRAWWLLRWLGHTAVAVLDGGRAAWLAAGGPLTAEPTRRTAATAPYPQRESLAPALDADALAARLGAVALLDARAPERFRGEVEPLDAKAGHIPGSLNRPFKDNLGAGARFKSAEHLRAEFAALIGAQQPAEVVHACGSGVTACHNLLAMEVAGLAGSVLYPGSWSEWSSDPQRPIALG
jgi:thiosulfate/3-mercaptopyruvate sulfurtransferase